MEIERRDVCQTGISIETRADGKKILSGYASVFYNANDARGTEYELWSGMKERIASTAFARALKEKHDVRALFNHDSNQLLGRSTAGTLTLSTDSKGLKYEIDIPDTQLGKDIAESVKRGDITGSSFAFQVTGRIIEEVDENTTIRTITDVNLIDVGPVTFPAYKGTTAGVRCHDGERLKREIEQELESVRLSRLHNEHRKKLLDIISDIV